MFPDSPAWEDSLPERAWSAALVAADEQGPIGRGERAYTRRADQSDDLVQVDVDQRPTTASPEESEQGGLGGLDGRSDFRLK
eukprot:5659740-Pyramimonas_sp.AAC.1